MSYHETQQLSNGKSDRRLWLDNHGLTQCSKRYTKSDFKLLFDQMNPEQQSYM